MGLPKVETIKDDRKVRSRKVRSKSKIEKYLKAERKQKEQMEGPKRKHLRSE